MNTYRKKQRVLLVTDFFYPHWTGIAKSVFSLTKALQDVFAITVLTVRFDKNLKQKEKVDDISIIRSDYLLTVSRSKYSFMIIVDFLRLVGKTDCVLINSPSANIVVFSILTKIFGKRLIIFHQGDLILPHGFHNRIIEKIFDFSCYVSFSLADKVATYTSDYAKHSRVIKPFLTKFTPVLLPISIEKKEQRILPVIEKFTRQNKIVFGFAGRFVEEKGFDILFRAIPLVMEQLPNAHFVIAGQEMQYEDFFGKNKALFESVKNHLTFLGLLNGKELQQFYSGIDCIVVPSRSDCFNLVQAEAMLCGTPAIVSDIPGLRYLVKESGFGMTFKSESSESLAEAIVACSNKKQSIMKNEKKLRELLDNEQIILHAKKFIAFPK
ncbi:MAG TPA: glycosyltransferase family 4 protein [Candidatus Acidoferrales bacterium]|nr:glycosyltransferase family 4 protein [Candidatus Acidoferrales bacterium]